MEEAPPQKRRTMERVGATVAIFYENLFFLRRLWRTNYPGNIQQLARGSSPPFCLLEQFSSKGCATRLLRQYKKCNVEV